MIFTLAGFAAASFWPADNAAAQDGFRQTVVVTGAARPVELGSVTRLMTVLTREQIATLPVESVADVLRLASSKWKVAWPITARMLFGTDRAKTSGPSAS